MSSLKDTLAIKLFCFVFLFILLFCNPLIAQNIDPNPTDQLASFFEKKEFKWKNIVELKRLIKAGADVNFKDKYSTTPLLIATCEGKTKIVKLLLKANANVNLANGDGITPLLIATAIPKVARL
jgi:ankyrin repeat protein